MKKNAKKFIIALLVVAAAGGFIAFNVFNANRMEAADGGVARNAPAAQWEHPHRQTIVSRVSARGAVELVDRTIVFPETQAQIVTVHVGVGDVVQVGDVLITYDEAVLDRLHDSLAEARLALQSAELGLAAARIAPTQAEILAADNQIAQARSNIDNIQAQLNQTDLQISQLRDNISAAQSTQRNVQTLFDSGVATRTELDNANDAVRNLEDQLAIIQSQRDATALGLPVAQEAEQLAVAQAGTVRNRNAQPAAVNQAQLQQVSIEQAQLRISQIQRDIDEFEREERAAAAGTVLSVMVEEGEFSATGRPLMEIADVSSDNLVIVVHVPENDAGNIAVGQEVEISGGALGTHTYDGHIQLIHPVAAPRQMGATLETVVTVEIVAHGTSRLRAGLSVDADIVTNVSENTLVLPLMATLSEGGGSNFVYIINDESILERKDITLGEFSEMFIEVIGISEYDRVVNNPTLAMHPEMQVRPIPPLN